MKVTKEEVNYIAKLAHLAFTEEEALRVAAEFSEILEHFDNLSQEDLKGIDPGVVEGESLRFREDRVVPFEDFEALYRNAQSMDGTALKIPRIVD